MELSMTITIDFNSTVPLYQQIKSAIIDVISAGLLCEGDALPSVRQLANDVGVNMLTINKVYTMLRQEGYIQINRKSGAVVALHLSVSGEFHDKIAAQIRLIATQAHSRNMSRADFIALCDSIYQELDRRNIK